MQIRIRYPVQKDRYKTQYSTVPRYGTVGTGYLAHVFYEVMEVGCNRIPQKGTALITKRECFA